MSDANPTRQIGEAVAWRWHHRNAPGNWRYQEQTFAQVKGMGPVSDYVVQPLIPASDLSTITRQRDEAVRLLRPFAEQAPAREGMDDWSITTTVVKYLRDAAAFLATVEDKP